MPVPSDEPYSDKDWSQRAKNYAAMITLLDNDIGRIVALLDELGIREDTVVIVTSDNPRDEDPHQIIKDIIAGFNPDFTHYHIEEDREQAIKKAIDDARKDDLVVIAGKGHEDYQIFSDRRIHFDDFQVAQKYLGVANG